MNAVIADFKVGQARAGFFAGFQVDQELPGVFAQRLQLVKLAVVAGLEHAAVTDHRRRVVDDGFFQQRRQFRVGAGGHGQLLQVRRFQLTERGLQLRQHTQGVAQAGKVTRARVAQADPRQNPLDIADLFQVRLQVFEAIAVQQASDGGLTRLQSRQIPQRAVQPAGQQAAAHGGLAAVDHRLQRVVTTARQVGVQFQVATAGAIQHHGVVQAFMAQATQVRQGGALGFLGVTQQATGGADGQGQRLATKPLEVLHGKLLAKTLKRRIPLEIPRCTAPCPTTTFRRQILGPIVRYQQLYRIDALQLREQVLPPLDLQHAEIAAGDVQHGQAKQPFIAQHRRNQVVAPLIQQRLITHRARRNNAHHLAFHRALAGRRVSDLLANHHRFAQLDQLGQVALQRVVRNSAHRDRLPGRLPTRRQGDVQQLGGLLRVLIEDLVEVAHAVEHQLIRVLVLEAPVLLHHRGMGRQIGSVFAHQIIGGFVKRSGAKGALGPADFAMAARLTRKVLASQCASRYMRYA
ncbi:MAG: hypothetical protein GAK37_02279 [Pseudomonas sp.]|nr:MAG: hypothetical protein GAK37_02279 [Pseudomonas sp.]